MFVSDGNQQEMVDERSKSAAIKLVIKPWAYEGEITVRIDPVHQTELLEHLADAGILVLGKSDFENLLSVA